MLGFCRSLEEEGQCMHKWLLKTSYLFAKWIEHIKKKIWRDWCANHTQSNVSRVKSHCYMPRINFRHLSSHLLLKETPQEANFPMVDSFTLLISKPQKSIHVEVPFSTAYVVAITVLFPITTTSWLHIYFPLLSFMLVLFFTMILHNHLFCTHIGWCGIH